MPENAIIPDGEAIAETAKEKFERERLSRRQALKKFGITSAMATFALFSVDDLARMVGKAMQQRARDNKVVEQIAQEFQQAGVVLAGATGYCLGCEQHYQNCISCKCNALSGSLQQQCYNNQAAALNQCAYGHCPGGTAPGPYPPPNSCGSVNISACA